MNCGIGFRSFFLVVGYCFSVRRKLFERISKEYANQGYVLLHRGIFDSRTRVKRERDFSSAQQRHDALREFSSIMGCSKFVTVANSQHGDFGTAAFAI